MWVVGLGVVELSLGSGGWLGGGSLESGGSGGEGLRSYLTKIVESRGGGVYGVIFRGSRGW